MDAKQLRLKVLDLAIHGKLVPQIESEEPASVLLTKIRAKRDKKEAKEIFKKKTKSNTTIDLNEAPFELPESWEWVRLGEIISVISGTSYTKNDIQNEGIRILRGGNIQDTRLILEEDDVYISSALKDESKNIKAGDIIIVASTGSSKLIGKPACIESYIENTQIGAFLRIVRPISPAVAEFLKILFCSDFYANYIQSKACGTNINNIKEEYLTSMIVPIPPELEQTRISAEVEKWMQQIDKIEHDISSIEKTAEQLRARLLSLAIQGKLVPQDIREGSGEDLLKRISADKQEKYRLWKHTSGKKMTPIVSDEIPFEIPTSWKWVRGAQIFEPMQSQKPTGEYFKYIDIDSIDNKNLTYSAKKILINDAPSRASRHTQNGDVLFSMVRPYLKNIVLVRENDCIASTGFYVCRSPYCFPEYIFYLMISPYVVNGLNSFMKGDNSPSINGNHIEDFLYPLPPFEEQKRIAKKIQSLMKNLDSIL